MKYLKLFVRFSVFLGLLLPMLGVADSVINPRYHTFDEIVAYADSIQTVPGYDLVLDVREIGRSTNEDLPIYAFKLSDNPTVDEDEAAVLFLGQCHAEEILGVEICMGVLDTLLHGYDNLDMDMLYLLQNMEIWVVPTYNPEGLRVVHDGWDVTYRKNKTDNNLNGVFDFIPGIGYDIDGVDFNRNYDFNWIFGDAYLVGDYDYYRGPAPFSEAETRAVADLARQEKFLLSVAYHSARSGTPEIIYYSWEWEDSKNPPDYEIMQNMGITLSERIINESGEGNYAGTPGKTPRGNAHDWFYTQTGSIQFLVEVGTNNLQPNAQIIDDTVDRNLEGLMYLMHRSLGRAPESKAHIRGIITDASDGFALEGARIEIAKLGVGGTLTEWEGLMVKPRVTDGFGRYRRLVTQGTYRVIVSAPGFHPDTVHAILASDNYATILDFSLEPVDARIVNLNFDQGAGNYTVYAWDNYQRDTLLLTDGSYAFQWQGEELCLEIMAPGFFPERHNINLTYQNEVNLDVALAENPVSVYSTGFQDMAGWTILSGDWFLDDDMLKTHPELFYTNGLEGEVLLDNLDLSAVSNIQRLGIRLKHAFEVEWHLDTLSLEVWSDDGSELLLKKDWVDQRFQQHDEMIYATGEFPSSVDVKLAIKADSTVGFRGWQIDSLEVIASDAEFVAIDEGQNQKQPTFDANVQISATLSPNPLEKQTRLDFTVPRAEMGTIRVFDIRGRQIYEQVVQFQSGLNSWVWDGQNALGHPVSAGVYLIQLSGSQPILTRKLIVMDKF